MTCGRRYDGKFNDISLRKIITCKKWKSFSTNFGKKEETSANKRVTLTENKCLDNFLLTDMILSMHAYVYKCTMVI